MRILVVEDEHKLAHLITRGLQQEGFAVDCEHDGTSGLAAAMATEYDCIVLDLMLPRQSGLEVLAALRAGGKNTPILILTALDAVQSRVAGLQAGADDYLGKPFAFEELVARVRALLRRAPLTPLAVQSFGDIVLTQETNTLTVGAKSVTLTVREFALLEYLLHTAPRTVSKDELIEHVWSFEDDILPNTVEVYVGYLRKKLREAKIDQITVSTERGIGYRIVYETTAPR
jgi:DNA-binding response OmpR family regulator